MSTDFEFSRYLGEVSPEELVSLYKGAARERDRSKRNAIEEEILARLHRARKNDNKVFTQGRDVQYPGNMFAPHPFESQLKSPRIRAKLKKDHSLAADIYSLICEHLLFRSEMSIIGEVQLDLFVDNYSATPLRISRYMAKLLGLSNEKYFCDKIPSGKHTTRAEDFVNRIGWEVEYTEKPPMLYEQKRNEGEGSTTTPVSRRN